MTADQDAVVVGSGPNGLAAAVELARAGLRVLVIEGADTIGGGTRSAELTVPGVMHDICSAAHPFAMVSPFLRQLRLEEFGLRWRLAPVDLGHPLDDGSAALLHSSMEQTARGLGPDADRWRRAFGPLVANFDKLVDGALGPLLRWPRHPIALAQLGARSALPATVAARYFQTPAARALFVGCAAHSFRPLDRPGTSAMAFMFIAAAHSCGWPVAEGGSAAITGALARLLESLGGQIVTGTWIRSAADLPPARVTLFDTTPSGFRDIVGERQPRRAAAAYRRYRHGAAAFKVDLAVRGGIPWTATELRRAGTVHLGGDAADIARGEAQNNRGGIPALPFTLLSQQYVADPGRSNGDVHPIWTYAHVPHGYRGDATDLVLAQIERFAPGTTERIVGQRVMSPADLQAYNPNYVGGDIITGASTLRQTFIRPRLGDPYATGIPGMFLCSAATPPGAGAHGMCGYYAARSALDHLARLG